MYKRTNRMDNQKSVFMPRMFAPKIYDETQGMKTVMTNQEFEAHLRSSFIDMFCGDFAKQINVRSHTDTSTGEIYFTAKVTFGFVEDVLTENIQRFFKDVSDIDPESRDYIKLNLPNNRFWKVIPDKKPIKADAPDVLVINACAIPPY